MTKITLRLRLDMLTSVLINKVWPMVVYFLASLFVAALLLLTGLPPTGGLIGKVYLTAAGIQGSAWLLVVVLVIGSTVGLFYYIRITMLLFSQPKIPSTPRIRVTRNTIGVLSTLAVVLMVLGLFPTLLIVAINRMVSMIG